MIIVNALLVGSVLLFFLGLGMTIVGRALVRWSKPTVCVAAANQAIDFRKARGKQLAKALGVEN